MIKSILESNLIEPTPIRIAIYRILENSEKPIDIYSISELLESELIKTNRVTIFRVINLFLEKGLINKLEFSEGKARYEVSSLPHHHHAVCTECGNVTNFEACEIETIEETLKKKNKFKIENHRLEFFGVCHNCQ